MKKDSFYIFGRKPIEEQIIQNPENILRIFILDKSKNQEFDMLRRVAKEHNIPINPITRNKMIEYAGDVNNQGVIALIKKASYIDFDTWMNTIDTEQNPAVLILDRIQDTHNFGALLRTAAAVGISGVIIAKDNQAPLNGTVYKTSAGAALRIPIVQVSNINQTIDKLKKSNFWTAAIDIADKGPVETVWDQTYDTPMAFVLGSEGSGIAEKTKEHVDFILSIPMENNVESLNVSVAGAVTLYEWKRQQKK